jgi:hypothetical protein
VVYVSIPDTSPTCANLGLPALPTSTVVYTYSCVTSANLRKTDGTGWIPVNFQRISSNSPISQLPIDPVNTTTTGNYYVYVAGGSWVITSIPESQKQRTLNHLSTSMGDYFGVMAMGNDMNISPLFSNVGLKGYWPFDEGGGSISLDKSGNGGTLIPGSGWGNWTVGKIGNALQLPAGLQIKASTSTANYSGTYSFSFWFFRGSGAGNGSLIQKLNYNIGGYNIWLPSAYRFQLSNHNSGIYSCNSPNSSVLEGTWDFYVVAFDGINAIFYKNGTLLSSCWVGSPPGNSDAQNFVLGPTSGGNTTFDELRTYNRVLSAAEVSALYNSTR